MSEEKKLHGELVNLHAILQKIRAHSAKLQEEYNAVVKDKRETEDKLHRLSSILQKTLEASSLDSSPPPAPARSILPNVSPSKSATTAGSSSSSTPPTSSNSGLSKSPPRAPSPTRKLLAFLSPRSRSASTAEQPASAENKL